MIRVFPGALLVENFFLHKFSPFEKQKTSSHEQRKRSRLQFHASPNGNPAISINSLSALDYIIVFIYLLGIITTGVWIARKVKTFTSFFIAGRMMTTPLLISSLVSTYYGLDVTFGVSEVSFSEGVVSWFIYTRPYYIGILIASFILIRRLKAFPFLSLPDVAEHFYGKAGRLMVAIASLLYNLPFLAIMGMGVRVKPSKNLTLAGFVASLQNLTEVVSHLSFHVLLLAL